MLVGFIILNIALNALLLWARAVLARFLTNHGSIQTEPQLNEYKSIARWNMYGALLFLVCGGFGLLWGIYLAVQEGLVGSFIVLVIALPSLLISLSTKALEDKSRSLPVADALETEYRRVSESWVRKVLPDF